jgi:hypothetical protein
MPDRDVREANDAFPVAFPAVPVGSALDCLEQAFGLLSTDPSGLRMQIRRARKLRSLRLDQVRDVLTHPQCSAALRQQVWRRLVVLARDGGPEWTVAAAGVALPALRVIAGHLSSRATSCGSGYYVADVDAELLTGFLTGLRTVGLVEADLFGLLLNAAYNHARRALRSELSESSRRRSSMPESSVPPAPAAHPDVVLARAVSAGVICQRDADLIGSTRLDGQPLTVAAAVSGASVDVCKHRRARAEQKLVTAIRSGALSWPF